MAYVKFLGTRKAYKASVIPNGNIVTLKFANMKEVNTSGFNLYLDEKCTVDIGGASYRGYTTMYRNDSETEAYNGYQLSNDGSVYSEPVSPTPEPVLEVTLEELKAQKIAEMNAKQQEAIQNGIDVKLSDGATHHFTLTTNDQISLMGLQTEVEKGTEKIPWHTSDQSEHCQYYSNNDMKNIVDTALALVTYHITMFRDLRIYINSMQDKASVESVYYGIYIPEEYQSEVLKDLYAVQNA